MPNLDSITKVLYNSLDPYHWVYDNLPLQNILQRIDIVNQVVDANNAVLFESTGTAPSLAARLNQSLESNGDLKTTAIDNASHNIAAHEDGSINLSPADLSDLETNTGLSLGSNPISFIRMTSAERAKLALISSGATNFQLNIETPSTTVLLDNATATLIETNSVQWNIDNSNNISCDLKYGPDIAHKHYYDAAPTMLSGYINYQTPAGVSYISGKLRVFINGIRISQFADVSVPDSTHTTWTVISFAEVVPASGTFNLSAAITVNDVILIDFDQQLS